MVAVQLPHARCWKQLCDQTLAINHAKPEIGEATLVAPACGVSNHDREQICCKMIEIAAIKRAAQAVPTIAAAHINNQWGLPAKQGIDIDKS
jgi:hypothetical protein